MDQINTNLDREVDASLPHGRPLQQVLGDAEGIYEGSLDGPSQDPLGSLPFPVGPG